MEQDQYKEIIGDLWEISEKIRGIGELFGMSCAEPPFSEEALKGFSKLLIGFAKEIDEIQENLAK